MKHVSNPIGRGLGTAGVALAFVAVAAAAHAQVDRTQAGSAQSAISQPESPIDGLAGGALRVTRVDGQPSATSAGS